MISVQNLTKSYGDLTVLDQVSFEIQQGERLSLVGTGGSGKTTILKMLLGLLTPDSGQACIDGKELYKLKPQEANSLLRNVGVAFQQGGLFDYMTVSDNMFFAMENMTEKSQEEMIATVEKLLDQVKLLRTKQQYPYELSGGMQRRVGIARALCTEPTIAFFDEPTSGLDPVTSSIILNMIDQLAEAAESQHTLVVATTNVEIAIRFSERILILHQGKVVADGMWKDLILNGSDWVKHFLAVRLVGLDIDYALELNLPKQFIKQHWPDSAKI